MGYGHVDGNRFIALKALLLSLKQKLRQIILRHKKPLQISYAK